MSNPKLLLMDFYLKLLAIPHDDIFRIHNQPLYSEVLYVLAKQLDTDVLTVQNIFERMAQEDEVYDR
jgi:hypothetical protein